MTKFEKPNISELELKGSWIKFENKIIQDEICNRIEWLINNYLLQITTDESGWEILYQDPETNNYWELTYPESEMHGGGPPSLKHISLALAKEKYKLR